MPHEVRNYLGHFLWKEKLGIVYFIKLVSTIVMIELMMY